MIFQSADKMLKYLQDGNDIWSSDLEKYVFLYGELGSIRCYNIDCEEAKKLEIASRNYLPKEYWAAFLGSGGNIYDTLEWYKDTINNSDNFKVNELYDHALAFCKDYYFYEWVDCSQIKV